MTNRRTFIALLAAAITPRYGFAAQPAEVSVFLEPT
jgi:hypothetical protein